jgi:hypothetical protein
MMVARVQQAMAVAVAVALVLLVLTHPARLVAMVAMV